MMRRAPTGFARLKPSRDVMLKPSRYLMILLTVAACSDSPTAPDTVTFREIGSGVFSQFSGTQVVVARDAQTWADVRTRLTFTGSVTPTVDFTKEMVSIVTLGQRPTGGFQVRVSAVTKRGNAIEIVAVEEAPGPTCATTQVITQPFTVIAMTRSDAGVDAAWSKATRNCP